MCYSPGLNLGCFLQLSVFLWMCVCVCLCVGSFFDVFHIFISFVVYYDVQILFQYFFWLSLIILRVIEISITWDVIWRCWLLLFVKNRCIQITSSLLSPFIFGPFFFFHLTVSFRQIYLLFFQPIWYLFIYTSCSFLSCEIAISLNCRLLLFPRIEINWEERREAANNI